MIVLEDRELLSFLAVPFDKAELEKMAQNEEMQKLFDEMIKTMSEYNGVGLAANQVGNNRYFCVIKHKPLSIVLLNPEIISESNRKIIKHNEGCLSVPGIRKDTLRYKEISVFAYTRWGGKVKYNNVTGDFAWVLQHEIDHLNGKLFLDRGI